MNYYKARYRNRFSDAKIIGWRAGMAARQPIHVANRPPRDFRRQKTLWIMGLIYCICSLYGNSTLFYKLGISLGPFRSIIELFSDPRGIYYKFLATDDSILGKSFRSFSIAANVRNESTFNGTPLTDKLTIAEILTH